MTALLKAQQFYEQLRELTGEQLDPAVDFPLSTAVELVDQTLAHMRPDESRDPRVRRELERIADRLLRGESDDVFSEMLMDMQDDIEATAAESFREGVDVTRRPLVRHMTTGQLNAVSLRVPNESDVYLILMEDQMQTFLFEICRVVALAVPSGDRDAHGRVGLRFDALGVAEQAARRPEIGEWFADIVVMYAATGKVGMPAGLGDDISGAHANLAGSLQRSFEYFVLGHEYAHVLLGHLDTAASLRGVLPVPDAEALIYSWQNEMEADLFGAILSIQASVNLGKVQLELAYMGISLFFDALDVMDRAVALLETGDEDELQLGSHPPAQLRKQRLREALTRMSELQPERSLKLAEAQEQILHQLWERTRPALLDLRRRGGRAAHTWRAIPKETAG